MAIILVTLVLLVATLVSSTILIITANYLAALLVVVGFCSGLFVVRNHIRLWIAFIVMQRGNFAKGKAMVLKIKKPEKYGKSGYCIYYYILGISSLMEQRIYESEIFLKKAESKVSGFMASIVYLAMCQLYASKREKKKAKSYIEKARKFSAMNPKVSVTIDQLEHELKSRKLI